MNFKKAVGFLIACLILAVIYNLSASIYINRDMTIWALNEMIGLEVKSGIWIPWEEVSLPISVDGVGYITPTPIISVTEGYHRFEAPFSFTHRGKTYWLRHWEDEATKKMLAWTPTADIYVKPPMKIWPNYMEINLEVKSSAEPLGEVSVTLSKGNAGGSPTTETTPTWQTIPWGQPFTLIMPEIIVKDGRTFIFDHWEDEFTHEVIGTYRELTLAMDRYFVVWANYREVKAVQLTGNATAGAPAPNMSLEIIDGLDGGS